MVSFGGVCLKKFSEVAQGVGKLRFSCLKGLSSPRQAWNPHGPECRDLGIVSTIHGPASEVPREDNENTHFS